MPDTPALVTGGAGYVGTYHPMSEAHLHRFTAEFDFRYSNRLISDRERADIVLKGISGKRLTYRRTDKLAAWLLHRSPRVRRAPQAGDSFLIWPLFVQTGDR